MSDSLLFESILDTSAAFMCVLDNAGIVVDINTRFAQIIGTRSRESLVGMQASEAVQGSVELKSFFLSIQDDAKSSYKNRVVVQPIHRNAEKPLWVKFSISQVHSASRGICTFICGTDVTDEILAAHEAEQKAHERIGFLVRMGHELRTPLNTISGYAQLLHGLEGLSPVALEYVNTIISNEGSLLRLLNDVLEWSKYESGQTTTHLAEMDLRQTVQEVTKSYIDQFEAKSLSLSVDFKTDVPATLVTDAQKVSQVLSNILANALKFTRKGGVSITVSCGKNVTIDVEDSGIGIEQDDALRIFEVFSLGGNSREHMTGSGIGLTVARLFARMLGGDVILVRSTPDAGSLFRFTFEAKPGDSARKRIQPIDDYTQIVGISRPCKVLLVDDVDINLAMLEIFLAPAGFDVSIAANGNEAVASFRENGADIVFMDLIMPEKDGFEATREIKALDASVPVIALTASIVDSVKEQAIAAGVSDFMTKPFVPERFFETITEYTGVTYTLKQA
jgi:PAS domain S-box-containing protein